MLTEVGVQPVHKALLTALSSGLREPSDIRLLVLREMEGPQPVRTLRVGTPHGHSPVVVERPPLSEYEKLLAVAV
jgi:hypothetical protein